ncbi:MAG TPA: SurA N-terminal domain-containing protein [Burkholderiaceae bacterium]|nr:SurA N-terminal domain-containing protein [Burkholderiaceae bacterium]
MFEFVRTHNRLLFFVLVLLIFPSFAFFGVQGYTRFNDPASAAVAKVDGQKITRAEWDAQHKRQVEEMRQRAPGVDVKLFDTPEARRQTLEALMRERVLFAAVARANLQVGDERLLRELQSIPQLAALRRPDGTFDVAAYKVMVESQGRTTDAFEAGVRQELSMRQVVGGIGATVPPSAAAARRALEPLLQQREVQVLRFDAREMAAGINPSDDDLTAFHKAHENDFRTTEQAQIEYVVLDPASLEQGVSVSDADLRKYYDENASRYTVAEERRASHILIAASKDAPADQRNKSKARAEALLADLRKNPAGFAEAAKKNSDDTLTAARGGDLEFNGRGGFAAKAQEDAIFAMKPGEISNVVETEFGYHVIRLDAVRGGDRKPFEQVRAEIEAEVKKQLAAKRFAEVAEQFTNLVAAQADSLQPVADKLKLKKQLTTVQRTPVPGATGVLAAPKLLEAIFSNDTLKNKLNTEAIEVGANQLAAARVVEHQPSRVQPLSEVQALVRARVVAEQAAAKARKAGEARLAELVKADSTAGLSAPVLLSRTSPQGQPRALVEAVLRADAGKLPQWVGVDLGAAGYALARIASVKPPADNSPQLAELAPRYTQAWADAEAQAYYKALERRFKAAVQPEALLNAAAASAPVQ